MNYRAWFVFLSFAGFWNGYFAVTASEFGWLFMLSSLACILCVHGALDAYNNIGD